MTIEIPARVRCASLEACFVPEDESADQVLFGTEPGWEGVDSTTWRAVRRIGVERWEGEEEELTVYVGDMDCGVFVCEIFPGYFSVEADLSWASYAARLIESAEGDPSELPHADFVRIPV